MPDEDALPPGPLRTLVYDLHGLYSAAGRPSFRTIAKAATDVARPDATVSHTTVSDMLHGRKVPSWQTLRPVVRVLAGRTISPDPDRVIRDFLLLWQAADGAGGHGADSAPPPTAAKANQAPRLTQEPAVPNRAVLGRKGKIAIYGGDQLRGAWLRAIDSSPLMELCDDRGRRSRLREVVEECAGHCSHAWDVLRRKGLADPWTDQDYPGRVLRNAEFLLGYDKVSAEVSGRPPKRPAQLLPREAAMLLAAPFLREAVFAKGIQDSADADPADLSRTYRSGVRGDLELTHEMHPHLVRRAAGLRQAGLAETADWLAVWLVHQWLNGRARLWVEPEARKICQRGQWLIGDCQGIAAGEVPQLVGALLLAVGADPAEERLLEKLCNKYMDDRWRAIAAILWLGGIMAADLRKLPPVVADLVGTGMELPLADIQAAAGRLDIWEKRPAVWEWDKKSGTALGLKLTCNHPAMHDAFENIVYRAARASQTIQSELSLQPDIAKRLPRQLSAVDLRPETIEDSTGGAVKNAYEVPLLRFQIAEEKIREFLIGRQLYGDPSLAIRELYQNALDACRWRATRQRYLELTDKHPGPWTGLIQFREGTDDGGRPYIECEDNGVGMDLNTIKHVFANAGERFVYGQDFRADQADWDIVHLRMVPNSQFGIGVFSYFMLADEIILTTRHQDRYGVAEKQGYEVRIVSSGSLFQVKPASDLTAAGTRVRLYLNPDSRHISALDTLRGFLAIAEYKVVVTSLDSQDMDAWEAGELRYRPASGGPCKCKDKADLWWVPGDGGVAADGIWTDVECFGLVVNLCGEHRPQFTIDRKMVLGWDENWVSKQIDDARADLMTWPGFTLNWLWTMARKDTGLASRIFDYAIKINKSVPVYTSWDAELARSVYHNAVSQTPLEFLPLEMRGWPAFSRDQQCIVPLGTVGCMPLDRQFFEVTRDDANITPDENGLGRWLMTWRKIVWQDFTTASGFSRSDGMPATLAGFPAPDPLDGCLFAAISEKLAESYNRRRSWRYRYSIPEHRSDPEEHYRRRVIEKDDPASWDTARALRRLRKYAITGLDVSASRHQSPDEMPELLSALNVAGPYHTDGRHYEWTGWTQDWVLGGRLLLRREPVLLRWISVAATGASHRSLTLPDLAAVAFRLQATLAEASLAIHEAAPEMGLPSLPAECADLIVSQEIFETLLNLEPATYIEGIGGAGFEFSWREPGVRTIVRGAAKARKPLGDYLGLLDQFRRLGAPVPPFDDEIRDALNQPGLDTNEAIMLDWPHLEASEGSMRIAGTNPARSPEVPVVTALRLVQIAGRFGWTLAQAHQRIARLTALGLSLEYPDAEYPNEIVRWHDLLLLTKYFDGQPPAISGRMDQAYLNKAAKEIFDAAPGEIAHRAAELRDRLKIYAVLFKLKIPEGNDDDA
jgi:hypothetical protein